jgi:hypothetical protein
MSELTFSANGEYLLPYNSEIEAMRTSSVRVSVVSNTASAVVEFGEFDDTDTFIAFLNGIISTDNTITPGKGTRLAASITGILSGSVTIRYFPID